MKRHFDDQRQCSDDGADDQDQESRRSVTNIELAIVQPATATSRFEPDYMRAKNGLCSTLWTKAEKGRSHHGRRAFPSIHPADRKSTRLNSSHYCASRMPSSA